MTKNKKQNGVEHDSTSVDEVVDTQQAEDKSADSDNETIETLSLIHI